ncbi:MAG TPA: Lrp/AsnC family transcriptional regulator [Luteibacter sp.]|jgi:Lrp/AsnC family leucine-responsive transcriptional regulator|nr:Lrp/AsnC family transcriptional regulator [Luteibacter sp.]
MIDDTDRALVALLARNSRISLKDLAVGIGLSSPSASERLRRLEERGVIRGYTVEVEPRLLGLDVQAIVRISPFPGRLAQVQKLIEAASEIVECDKVTGEDCFVVRLFVRSMEHLNEVVGPLADEATTNTLLVKSQVIRRRLPPMTP